MVEGALKFVTRECKIPSYDVIQTQSRDEWIENRCTLLVDKRADQWHYYLPDAITITYLNTTRRLKVAYYMRVRTITVKQISTFVILCLYVFAHITALNMLHLL